MVHYCSWTWSGGNYAPLIHWLLAYQTSKPMEWICMILWNSETVGLLILCILCWQIITNCTFFAGFWQSMLYLLQSGLWQWFISKWSNLSQEYIWSTLINASEPNLSPFVVIFLTLFFSLFQIKLQHLGGLAVGIPKYLDIFKEIHFLTTV